MGITIEITSLVPDAAHAGCARVIHKAIRSSTIGTVRLFGILFKREGEPTPASLATGFPSTNSPSANEHRVARLATAVEDIAMMPDLPSEPRARLAAVLERVRSLFNQYVGTLPLCGACIGIAYADGHRLAVTIAPAGAVAAIAIQNIAGKKPRIMTIAAPEAPETNLRFRHAIDGALGQRDALIIGPASLLKMRQTGRDIPEILAVLQADAKGGGIIVAASSLSPQPQSQASMNTLLDTANSTERFLTPSLSPILRQYASQLRSTLSLLRYRQHRRQARQSRVLPFLVHVIRLVFRTIAVAARGAVIVVIDALRLLRIGARFLRRAIRKIPRIPWRGLWQEFRMTGNPSKFLIKNLGRARVWYVALPKSSQLLLLLTITFAALFLVSTAGLWRKRTAETEITTYNTTIAKVDELRSLAEARLLYNDQEAARSILREALDRVAALSAATRPRRERKELLITEISAALDRARSLTRLPQPLLVASAPSAPLADIALVGTQLIALAADGRQFTTINPRTGDAETRRLTEEQTPVTPLRALPLDDHSFLIIGSNAQATAVDMQTGVTTRISVEQTPAAIEDAAIFRRRLYLLHRNGTITRHERTASGFSKGVIWLPVGQSATKARSITVAGTVFVSRVDGELVSYLAGRRQETDLLRSIDPPLTGSIVLDALPDNDTLILGDPTDGRVIAIKTNGALIGQIQSDAFRGLTRIVRDPSGASIYILHNNEISVIVPPKEKK